MTTDGTAADDPFRLLSSARGLARRVRLDQRMTWFPLLIFAVLTFGVIPVRRYSEHYQVCSGPPGMQRCTGFSQADLVYWPIALVLAYLAIATFVVLRSWARGIDTRARPYAIAGIVVAVVLSAVMSWELHHPMPAAGPFGSTGLWYRLASPGVAIGIALLVLTWAERNRALLLVTVGYLAVVLVPITFGPDRFDPPWYSAPALSQGTVLLLAGIGFALAQRPLWSRAQ
jgi:hypothetical protein